MNPHVLIVDDEDGPREALEFVLRRENKFWRISTASSPEEARRVIESPGEEPGPVDVVLTDLVMGANEAAGMEVIDFARRKDPFVMTILFTAKSKSLNRFEAFELGAFDCIEKNILGRAASQEIVVKTKAAAAFRSTALAHLKTLKGKSEAEAALKESEERYAMASRAANDGLWDWDLQAGTIYYSPRWKALLGFEEDQLEPDPEEWFDLVAAEDLVELKSQIRSHLLGSTPRLDCEYRVMHRDGSLRWMACRALAHRGHDGSPRRLVGSQADITPRKELEEQLRAQVFVDPLTGLANRALFIERVSHAVKRGRRPDGDTFAVLAISFDRFQRVNETYGGDAGDRLLMEIGRRLAERVRAGDTVARLGGVELAVLLEDCADLGQATRLAERLQESLGVMFALDEHEVYLTSRAGLCLGGASDDAESLLRACQTAASRARSNDRSLSIYQETMKDEGPGWVQLETDLRRAVERDELVLHYQPILRLATKKVVGFEALIRWQHPKRGLVAPDEFIPIAEESGLVVELGRWALESACRQMVAWQRDFPQSAALTISVNVSGRQWLREELPGEVAAVLAETGLAASNLKLEITESVLMDDRFSAAQMMAAVRDLGVAISVDDFGTGYSSMSALHNFPVSELKIDRTFLQRLDAGSGRDEIVSTIVELATKFGLSTVAEGIETAQQLAQLTTLGCDFGQGFLFAKPMTVEEADQRLFGRRAAHS